MSASEPTTRPKPTSLALGVETGLPEDQDGDEGVRCASSQSVSAFETPHRIVPSP